MQIHSISCQCTCSCLLAQKTLVPDNYYSFTLLYVDDKGVCDRASNITNITLILSIEIDTGLRNFNTRRFLSGNTYNSDIVLVL